jgi:hypothetical protein
VQHEHKSARMRERLAVRRQGRRLMARQAGRRASGRCVRASLRGARRPQPALGRGWSGAEHAAAHRKAVRCRSSRPAQPDQPLQPALRPSWSRPARWEAGPRPVVVTAPSCARNYSARALRPAASRCGSVAIGAESRAAEPSGRRRRGSGGGAVQLCTSYEAAISSAGPRSRR